MCNLEESKRGFVAFCRGCWSQFPSTEKEWNEGTGSLASCWSQECGHKGQICRNEQVSRCTAFLQWLTYSVEELPPDYWWKWSSKAMHHMLQKQWYRQETLGHRDTIEHNLVDHWQTWMEGYRQPHDLWSMGCVNMLWDCRKVAPSQNWWGRQ